MLKSFRRLFYSTLMGLLLACAAPVVVQAQQLLETDVLPDDCAAALALQGDRLGPISVTWERTRTSSLSAEEATRRLGFQNPQRQTDFLEPETVRMKCDDVKQYAHTTRNVLHYDPVDQSSLGLIPMVQERAFDSQKLYLGNGLEFQREQGLDALEIIDRIERYQSNTEIFLRTEEFYLVKYFLWAGFRIAEAPALMGTGPKSIVLHDLDRGFKISNVEEVKLGEATCLKVTLQKDETRVFYLDRNLNFALRRRDDFTTGGKLICRAEMSEFHHFAKENLWLPQRCDVDYYGWTTQTRMNPSDEVLLHETYRATEIAKDPISKNAFVLNYTEPGSRIADGTLPGAYTNGIERIEYIYPDNPADLQGNIDAAIAAATKTAVATRPVLAAPTPVAPPAAAPAQDVNKRSIPKIAVLATISLTLVGIVLMIATTLRSGRRNREE